MAKRDKVICDHAGSHPRICPACDHGVEHEVYDIEWDCRKVQHCRMGSDPNRILERATKCVPVKEATP
jgi:hypothetical protein